MSVDYDPFSPQVMQDPHPVYKRLRDESPCHHVERWDCWALSRFEDVWNASMDGESYSTAQGTTPGQLLTRIQPVTPMLNLMDPPAHTELRAQIRKFFTPGRVASLEAKIREFVEEAFGAVAPRGQCDVFGEVASRVSVNVACLANGFPLEDGPMLKGLVDRFFAREEGVEGMTEDGVAAAMELNAYFEQLVRERRRAAGDREDVVSAFLAAEVGGRPLADPEIASHLSMLMIGGSETFPKVFSNGVYRLFQHPDQRAACAKDPALLPDAFNEILRYDMPTQFLGRTLLRDVTLHGQTLRKGQVVLFLFASANRDDREFPDPDVFDVQRRARRILSFGHGIHSCLGAHFARMEGKLCLEVMLRQMPDYEVQEDRLRRLRTEFVQGWESMPIRFEPKRPH